MDVAAIRRYVNDHPEGVVIRMVDGTEYEVPHRDYIWFTPATAPGEERAPRQATSFYVAFEGYGKLVNSLLVAEVYPMTRNGNGTHSPRRKKSR